MSVSYDVFSGAFLEKVKEYGFPEDDYLRTKVVDGYMKRAIAEFKSICLYDFSTTADDITREFNVDVDNSDIDELANIISEGMLVQWMKPYVYRQEAYENLLSTRDFTVHSPANLGNMTRTNYEGVKKAFTNMMREYSYVHGDLTDLHL